MTDVMSTEIFEALLRLGLPLKERWDKPDPTEVIVDMFRKRSKPVTWRPIIDPHIYLFYDKINYLKDALERVSLASRSTSRTKRTSLRVRWYSLSKTEAFNTAKEELTSKETQEVRLYPFGLESLLGDIQSFRGYREEQGKKLGYPINPSVGVILFIIDLDSISKEEMLESVKTGVFEDLLFGGLPSRVFLMLVSKTAKNLPLELLTMIEFGFFLGDSAAFVQPFLDDDTIIRRPLVFRDSRGVFYQAWRNEAGNVYDRRYSLNERGRKKLLESAKKAQDFVDWIEGLDDGE